MKPVRQQHVVTAEQAGRIDRVVQALTKLSRARVRALFQRGAVTLNRRPCPRDFTPVQAGDAVEVVYDPHNLPREKRTTWRDPAFRIVFEDAHLIVVDKAAHVLTVPTDMGDRRTLLAALRDYLRQTGPRPTIGVVQRLDRGTSGLLVFAKSDLAYQRLRNQFAQHTPQREYLALVAGVVAKDAGVIRSYLKTGDNLSRYSTEDTHHGELAVTHFRVERRGKDVTLLRCRLETGRRNQIRVHCAEAGHPVLGDPRYERKLARHPRWRAKRLALHAAVLGFTHPLTGKPMRFESPLPAEFNAVLGRSPRGVPAAPDRGRADA